LTPVISPAQGLGVAVSAGTEGFDTRRPKTSAGAVVFFDELVIERYKHVQNDETDKEQCK
jgi:hypothetical protein